MKYFDEYGLLQLSPEAEITDNGILFLAEWYVLQEPVYPYTVYHRDRSKINQVIKKHMTTMGEFCQNPENRDDPASHDNLTAIMVLSKKCDLCWHKNIKIWGVVWHPRDIIFYSLLRGRWYDRWAYCFRWLLGCIQLVSCLRKYKKRDHGTFIATDSKLLYFVRKSVVSTWADSLCDRALKKHFGQEFWYQIFKTYFQDENHPNRILSEKLYD